MSDERFEADLARHVSGKAGWRAPASLRASVAAIPDEFAPEGRMGRLLGGASRVAELAAVAAVVVVVVAGLVWARYGAVSPGSGGTPLTIQTEASPQLPSGAVGWLCLEANGGPVQVERSGSELVFLRSGVPRPYVWPHGFSARLANGKGELLDPDGRVIAREGDVIDVGGGLGASGDAFHICSVNGVIYWP